MNPGKFDFSMYRGDSYAWRFVLWTDDAKTVPLNLTGAAVDLEVRDKPAGSIVFPIPCVIVPPNNVDVIFTPEMYDGCPAKGVWDMQITFSDGEVQTPIGGSVSITQDITKSVPVVRKR
jgi:hypothetical protein